MASKTVLMIPAPPRHAFGRRMFAGMVSAAYELPDVQLALCLDDEDPAEQIRSTHAHGAIVGPREPAAIDRVIDTGVPVVGYLNTSALRRRMTVVTNDDEIIGKLAAEHFLAMGHRHFATFVADDGRAYFHPRLRAFTKAVEQAGFTVSHGPFPPRVGSDGRDTAWDASALAFLQSLQRPLALFAPYDYYGYVAVNLCHQLGYAVPRDVAIVGVDDDDVYCAVARPQLSSVSTAAYEIGRRSLRVLHGLLNGRTPDAKTIYVQPNGLIARGSSNMEAIDDADVAQAVRFIREHVSQKLSVDDVVQNVMISRRSLERRFLSALHRTIREQIRHVRVEQAKRLLVDTDFSLADVARQAGLMPQQRLQTVFKSMTGYTPGAYRSQFQRIQ